MQKPRHHRRRQLGGGTQTFASEPWLSLVVESDAIPET